MINIIYSVFGLDEALIDCRSKAVSWWYSGVYNSHAEAEAIEMLDEIRRKT